MLKKYNPFMAEHIVKSVFLSAYLLHHRSHYLLRAIHTPWQFLAKDIAASDFFKRLSMSAKMENAPPAEQNI